MAEAATAGNGEKAAKKERVAQVVAMKDGRNVEFVGTQRAKKDWLIDETKVQLDEAAGMLVIQAGAVTNRFDFINGEVRSIVLPLSLICDFAGHGASQKFGDTYAASKDKPMSTEDMILAVENLAEIVKAGKWKQQAEGDGGFSGASIVIQAFMEYSGKDSTFVKEFLAKQLDTLQKDAALKGTKPITRKELYDSYKNPNSKIGKIIQRMEQERLSKESKVDADASLAEFEALAQAA